MKTQYFAAFDSATQLFLPPFPAQTIEEAIRGFRSVVNRPDHQFNQFPEDYTLFHLGEFDTATGAFTSLSTPHNLGLAVSFLASSASSSSNSDQGAALVRPDQESN